MAPVSPGWFVVNVGEAAWLRNDDFGGRCVFESSQRVLVERPELEPQNVTLAGAKRACRLGGLAFGYSQSPEELERVRLLLAIVGGELLTVRATAWDVPGVDGDLERIVGSFRLTSGKDD